MSDDALTLLLLGDMAVVRTPHDAPAQRLLAAGKPVALLAYLAAAPGRTATREQLIDILWSDLEPDAARHALRQTIWYLKRRSGESLVTTASDRVRLSHDLASDVDAFLVAVDRHDHAAAVACYNGDFAPGFAAPGAAGFEHWADGERHRLRSLFNRAAEQHVRALLSAGRGREALALGRRVRDAEPLAQPGWRLLLEVLVSAGDPVVLTLELERFRQLVAAEDLQPDAATLALLRLAERRTRGSDVGDETPMSDPEPRLVPELVGRERHFATAIGLAERVPAGQRQWLHLHGAAGIGKSRLLADLATRLRAMRYRVRAMRARPAERDIAWSFAADVVTMLAGLPGGAGVSAPHLATLVELAPALRESYPRAEVVVSPASDVRAIRTRAIAELLAAVADDRPVVLLLDDLHWADADSRDVLVAAIDRAASARLLAITAARPPLAQLGAAPEAAAELELPPLDEADMLRLLSSLGDLPDESWSAAFPSRLVAASGGSPLLALETLQLAVDRGLMVLSHRRWHAPRVAELFALLDAGGPLMRRVARLGDQEREVLLLLAAAGAPVDRETLGLASSRYVASLDGALLALERRGLVRRDGDSWTVTHDEIAAGILAIATPDHVGAAGAAVGRALTRLPDVEERTLVRAARLLVVANDPTSMGDVVRRWVDGQRRRGRRDSTAVLVRELVGERERQTISALVAEVPWPRRVLGTRVGRAAMIAAALLALLPIGVVAAPLLRDPPDATVAIRAITDDGQQVVFGAPVRLAEWRAGDPIVANRVLDGADTNLALIPDPSGEFRGVATHTYEDSGAIDLVLVDGNGKVRRLTEAKGDDFEPSFAPDGSAIAFFTDRYDGDYKSDIAVIDPHTGQVRQLTRGPAKDVSPQWSPDGTRIAFIRRWGGERHDQLCWITFDGTLERCSDTFAPELLALLGWRDASTVVVAADRGAQHTVALVTADGVLVDSIGPSGRLVQSTFGSGYYVVGVPTRQGQDIALVSIDRPDAPRTIAMPDATTPTLAAVTDRRPRGGMIASLSIDALTGAIRVATRHGLHVRAVNADGQAVPAPVMQWSVSDTSIASIDSSGVLVTVDTGIVTVHASAGGWRSDSTRVVVRGGQRPRTLVKERWTADAAGAPWRLFGQPLPRLVQRHDSAGVRRALHLMGDGVFASGLYHEAPLTARGGLGAEVEISVPITRERWQGAYLALASAGDADQTIVDWGGRSEVIPRKALAMTCSLNYPVGETGLAKKRFAASSMGIDLVHEAVPANWSGKPMRWRLQILADGRCGVAIDGKVVMLSRVQMPVDQPWHLWLFGNSVQTDVTVGSVEIWQGVRPDIDWTPPPATGASRTTK